MELRNFIKTRRSNRNFTSAEIDDEIINELLSTAVQAPSSKNIQNWLFIVLRNDKKQEIIDIVEKELETNFRKDSATSSVKRTCEIMKVAPVLILVFNKSTYLGGKKEIIKSPTEDNFLLWSVEIQGVSAAIQNLLLAAHSYDLGSLWIADILFASKEIEEKLECNYDLVAGISIGHCDKKDGSIKDRKIDALFL
jgi:nitroreductase